MNALTPRLGAGETRRSGTDAQPPQATSPRRTESVRLETPTNPHVRAWLLCLAKLVSPAFPAEATASLAAMVDFLEDFPVGVWLDPRGGINRASLEAAACSKRRQSVPALDELRAALGGWWRENDPTPRLAARRNADLPEGRQPPAQAEVAAVTATLTAWRRERAAQEVARVEAKPPIKRTRQDDLALLGNLVARAKAGDAGAGERARALRLRLEEDAG